MKRFFALFFTACLAALALSSLVSCSDNRESSDGVQLILSSDTLAPSTTFELRFDEPVVEPGAVGQPADRCPLLIEPPLQGRFVWLSRRSGVFTPLEPTALGTVYRFTLRRGLKDDAGRRLEARLHRTLRTPEFAVEHGWLGFSAENVPTSPEIKLNFNADVHPDAAQAYLEFRNRAGQRIPARAVHATGEDHFYLNQWYPGDVMMPWRSRFTPAFPSVPPSLSPVAFNESNQKTNLDLHRLIVTPQRPLPVGSGWKLVVAPGLPSAERTLLGLLSSLRRSDPR